MSDNHSRQRPDETESIEQQLLEQQRISRELLDDLRHAAPPVNPSFRQALEDRLLSHWQTNSHEREEMMNDTTMERAGFAVQTPPPSPLPVDREGERYKSDGSIKVPSRPAGSPITGAGFRRGVNASPPYILTLAAAMIALVLIGFIILGMNRSSMQVAQAATDTPTICIPREDWMGRHVVGEGDTLFNIAQIHNIEVNTLIAANCLNNPTVLEVGHELRVPTQDAQTECVPRSDWLREYIVQEGDTLFSIAASLGLEVNDLIEGNCLTNPDLTYVGQVIFLPPNAPVTPFDACIFSAAVIDSIVSRPEMDARTVAQLIPNQVMRIAGGKLNDDEWYRVRLEIEESFVEGWIRAHGDLHGTICDVQWTPQMFALCNVATTPSQTFLRTRPQVNSDTVTILPAGHELAVFQIVGNPAGLQWFNARTVKDGEVYQGWVRQDSLSADSEACPPAPNSVVASVPTATLQTPLLPPGSLATPSDEQMTQQALFGLDLTATHAAQAVIFATGTLPTPSDEMLQQATAIIGTATQQALDMTATAFPTTPTPTISPELPALCTVQARENGIIVRAQPQMNSERVALLPADTPIDVIAQQLDPRQTVWYNVRLTTDSQTVLGWVRADTVDVAGVPCPPLPGVQVQTERIQIEIPMELVLMPTFDVTDQVHILVNSLIDPESASTVPEAWESSVQYSGDDRAQFTMVTFFVPALNNPLEPGQNHILIVNVDETKAEILQWIVDNRLPMTIFNAPHSLLAPAAAAAISRQIELSVEGAGDLETERVIIRNNGDTIDLGGWELHTFPDIVYTFAENRRLFGGAQIEIYTRAGTDTPVSFYWGLDETVFFHGERVFLTDANGTVQAHVRAEE